MLLIVLILLICMCLDIKRAVMFLFGIALGYAMHYKGIDHHDFITITDNDVVFHRPIDKDTIKVK